LAKVVSPAPRRSLAFRVRHPYPANPLRQEGVHSDNDGRSSSVNYERLFEDHLGLITDVVRGIARRHGLSSEDAEELRADVHLKLVQNDYEVLRRFEGRSSLRTYLTAVVHKHHLDKRIARWGKWRPSESARRLGRVALLLERLVFRDGLTFDQAAETLRTHHGINHATDELLAMYEQMPRRVVGRHFVDEQHLDTIAATTLDEKAIIQQIEDIPATARVEQALREVIGALLPQDRLILKMHFVDELQVSWIARTLALDARQLYRRIPQILDSLKHGLEQQGIGHDQVHAIIGHPATELGRIL
jgi:RNA polymerase sigma factor (sigma-70 family)